MNDFKQTGSFLLRCATAAVALLGILYVFADKVFPQHPFSRVAFFVAVAVLIVLSAAIVTVAIKAHINQFILRHGGLDTGWLWFSRNPSGLVNKTEDPSQ